MLRRASTLFQPILIERVTMHPHLPRITHAHLHAIAATPERFKSQFLDLTDLPTLPKDVEAIERGRRFHQLMQQHFLGLDIGPLLAADADLERYFRAYQTHPPDLIAGTRHSECVLTSAWGEFQLYGVLDLLVLAPDRAQIVDWKTYRRPAPADRLCQHWQTRLYSYLLAENASVDRAALSVTYWFAEAPDCPVVIPYSDTAYEKDRDLIGDLLGQLEGWLTCGFPEPEPSLPALLAVDCMPELPLP